MRERDFSGYVLAGLLVALWWALGQLAFGANVGHWKLQDNAASTTVVATVGSNGVLSNAGNTSASTVSGPGAQLNAALNFDGTNDYVACTTGNTGILNSVGVATLCGWAKVNAITGGRAIVYVGTGSSTTRALIRFTGTGAIEAGGRAGDAETFQSVTTTAEYDDNAWHHIAAVINYASDAITIYVDGVSVATTGTPSFTAVATGAASSTNVAIATNNLTADYMQGALADVRVYNSNESTNLAAIIAERNPSWLSLNPCD